MRAWGQNGAVDGKYMQGRDFVWERVRRKRLHVVDVDIEKIWKYKNGRHQYGTRKNDESLWQLQKLLKTCFKSFFTVNAVFLQKKNVSCIIGTGAKSITFWLATRFALHQNFVWRMDKPICVGVCETSAICEQNYAQTVFARHSELKIETDQKNSENRFVNTKRFNFAIGLE